MSRERVPLDPDLVREAKHVATVTRTPEADTCPLACVTYADEWVVEVTKAVAIAADLHIPIGDQIGRDLTRADFAAIAAIKQAQGAAWTSDEKIREQQRKRPPGGAR